MTCASSSSPTRPLSASRRTELLRWGALPLALATMVALPEQALAVNLTSGGGFLFDIQDGSGAGGYLSNGSDDAYDSCYYLDVGGTRYAPSGSSMLSVDGRTVTLPAATLAGLSVRRSVYVPVSGGDWARYADTVTNAGTAPVTTTIRISGNLGSDSGTRLMATSSGDGVLDIGESWFATDDTDGSGDPSLVHILQGGPSSGALVSVRAVSQSTDSIEWTFDVTVAPGGSATFLTYAIQARSQALAQAEARRLMDYPDDGWVGLETVEPDVVNFPSRVVLLDCTGARVGARCDDGFFCTQRDRCTAEGTCVGTGDPCNDGNACTIDVCTEATDSCTNEMATNRCVIGGECVAEGGVHPGYPCLVCDPATNNRDWSPRSEGTVCGEGACSGGRVTPAATCSATGACLRPAAERCAAGYCADATTCATTCEADDCPGGSYCAPSGVCEHPRANGSSCANDGQCASSSCVDRICCDTDCTGTCRSCAVPGSVGTCVDAPAMTDPDLECVGSFCDGAGACAVRDGGVMADAGPVDAGPLDAGPVVVTPDAAVALDARLVLPDANLGPPSDGGGGCSVGANTARGPGSLAALALALAALVRRRRR